MEVRLVDMSESASRAFGFRTDFTESTDLTDFGVIDEDGNVSVGDDGILESVLRPESAGFVGFPYVGNSALQINHINDISIFGNRYTIDMELNAFEARNEAVTLANPIILSLNNKEAEIEIKRQIPYQDAVNTAQGSVATIKFQDIGTKILFLPRITNNGFVQMEITPEQKIQVGQTETGVPIVDERNAVTSVIVRDEQTVALGGLRQFASTMGEDGVPWLLRAPVVKWLFKNQRNSQERVELFIFVTPHIVKDPEPTSYELGMYEKIDYNWDLPDYYFDEVIPRKGPRESPDPYTKIR
jgi:type II secretory pathway component GspD/PulD (secretin)